MSETALAKYIGAKAMHDDGRVRLDISFEELLELRAGLRAVSSHDALVSLLETAGDFLEDSRSKHVAGSSSDEAWDRIRASLLADIRASVGTGSKT